MEKRIALLAFVLIAVGMSSSAVFALPPMGPPRGLLGENQWAVGVEYAHGETDLEAYGRAQDDPDGLGWLDPTYSKHRIENLTSNMFFGRLGYGISDNWDVFVRLGASEARDDMTERRVDGSTPNEYTGLDCSYGFAWGLGTRATFWRDGDLTWGGLFQITWESPDDGDVNLRPSDGDPGLLTGDAELDLREIQIATGPTLQLEDLIVYGGPFLNFVEGDLDISVSGLDSTPLLNRLRLSQDVREESQFGGYAGAHLNLRKNTSCYIEYQTTSDAWGIGIGVMRRFK
jgi:hypothetical protein